MNNQIPTTPLIIFYEYEKCYSAILRNISKFFDEDLIMYDVFWLINF